LIADLTGALEGLAGSGVAVAIREIVAPADPLWPAEQIAMARALPARLAEFSAGRAAARAAIRHLGLPPTAIPVGPDRAPIWPAGVVGSISHTAGVCAAIVAQVGAIHGIGVDLEPNEPLDTDLWAEVCGDDELEWLAGLPKAQRGQAARLIFSAKECTYKCIYPQVRTVLGFDAIAILPDLAGGGFAAKPRLRIGPFSQDGVLCGGYVIIGGLIATVMVLR
jgi:4'-phosphopantetheinyl transferase EntD